VNTKLVATAKVSSGGVAVKGVSINFKAVPRNGGNPINGSVTTDANGTAVFTYSFNPNRDRSSVFDLTSSAKVNGLLVTGTAVFELR
jgi:hypothetical protein